MLAIILFHAKSIPKRKNLVNKIKPQESILYTKRFAHKGQTKLLDFSSEEINERFCKHFHNLKGKREDLQNQDDSQSGGHLKMTTRF